MRKLNLIFVLFFTLLIYEFSFSKLAQKNEVQNLAKNFLAYKSSLQTSALKKQVLYSINRIEELKDPNTNELLAFIVNVNPKGFLIVSPDTNMEPIIAYSFRHNWSSDTSQNNVFYQILVQNLKARKEKMYELSPVRIKKNNTKWKTGFRSGISEKLNSYQWPEGDSTTTGGWIETTWQQDKPYNNFCPRDPTTDSSRCLVGCVATAMAQVVNYHKHIGTFTLDESDKYQIPSRDIFIDADSTNYDFPNFSRLNGYLEQIEYKYENNLPLITDEIYALNFICGILIKMNYASESSEASPKEVELSLLNKMDYHNADYVHEDKAIYNILIENMMNGFPVLLELTSATGGGHEIIADGYNTDGFFHLNFGYGDSYPRAIATSWYSIPEGLPLNYTGILSAVLNIKPQWIESKIHITTSDSIIYLRGSLPNEASEIRQVILKNAGDIDININDILSSENFYISLNGIDFNNSLGTLVLQPGDELELHVKHIPQILGLEYGIIQIISSYSKENGYLVIELVGCGMPGIGTTVSEDVYGIWDKSSSPYYICSDIFIPQSEKLELTPGTQIIFMRSFRFTVGENAQLIAKGTATDSVTFCAFDKNVGWLGLSFENSSNNDTLSYCVLTGGYTDGRGGVISITSTSPTIAHSRLVKNHANSGGAISLDESLAKIRYVRMEDNNASTDGGAMWLYKSSPIISNVIVCNNNALHGGAIYGYNSALSFVNVTISKNVAQRNGGGILLDGMNNIEFKNSIVWANLAENGSTISFNSLSPDTIEFNYSNIDTTKSNSIYDQFPSSNNRIINWNYKNISKDPFFCDMEKNNFMLQKDSPCIDDSVDLLLKHY